MRITYANSEVEKYFTDINQMKRIISFDIVRAIMKLLTAFEAAETFGDFLKTGLGRQEALKGTNEGKYSLRVSGNVRLIIAPYAERNEIMICKEIEVEGVCDYHGSKENWYIR